MGEGGGKDLFRFMGLDLQNIKITFATIFQEFRQSIK